MIETEHWLLIDSNGDFWINKDIDELDEDHEAVHPTRLLKITMRLPAPVHVELDASVPPETSPITMTVGDSTHGN